MIKYDNHIDRKERNKEGKEGKCSLIQIIIHEYSICLYTLCTGKSRWKPKVFFFFSSFAYYSGLHIKIINCFRILNYIHYFRCIIGLSRRVNVFNVVESGFSLKEE